MELFEICGGAPLWGSVRAQGAKNSVLPILAASLLSGDGCRIENCPALSDVEVALDILRCLGCSVQRKDGCAEVDASAARGHLVPDSLMREMRSSVLFLGAMLAHCGAAEVCLPGGCRLGPRPVDLHLDALELLGAEIECGEDCIRCRADRLHGAVIRFPFVSVGATENVMIAAATAQGDTIIHNAAREPEIVDLQNFLNGMGADVRGAGSGTIHIRGVKALHGARHRVIPDRIMTATVLCAAAACGGNVCVQDCTPGHLEPVLELLHRMGCELERGETRLRLRRRTALRAVGEVVTAPYPGFPTDAQPLAMAAALKAAGRSAFTETIFENRFAHVPSLRAMGAEIELRDKMALVRGVTRLRGCDMAALDLRGGAALMIAALSAEGLSRVSGAEYINRGYEEPETLFAALGAEIRRGEVSEAE